MPITKEIAESKPTTVMLHNVDEAAFILCVSPTTVRRWMKDGTLKVVRLSAGVVRVENSELERFVKEAGSNKGGDRSVSTCR